MSQYHCGTEYFSCIITQYISGKSTLLLTLLRLLELQSGNIEVDGIDIKHVKLDLIRQRCFVVVSQDPVLLLNETLRFNLDPDSMASEDALIIALTKTGLWSHFFKSDSTNIGKETATGNCTSGFGRHSVFDREISLFQELSMGQHQLFILCRALIKARLLQQSGISPVVIFDEVTSSLDTATESMIHHLIDDEFTKMGHTVIIITHRLHALEKHIKTGRDSVVLIRDGMLQEIIKEFDPATFTHTGQTE